MINYLIKSLCDEPCVVESKKKRFKTKQKPFDILSLIASKIHGGF